MKEWLASPIGRSLAAIAATLLWGSAFPVIKLSYEQLHIASGDIGSQILFAGYRFFLSGVLILLFMLIIRQSIAFREGSGTTIVQIALVQTVLQYFFFYVGLSTSTGVYGSILAGTISLFQLLLARWMLKEERITRRKALGLIIGFAGVGVIGMPQGGFAGHTVGIGELLLLFANFFSAGGNIMSKAASSKLPITYINGYQMLSGGALLILAGTLYGGLFPFSFTYATFFLLLYLAFLSAAAFMLWNVIMKYNPVGLVSVYLFLIPVFGVLLSAIFLQESLHLDTLLSLLLIVIGITVVNAKHQKSKNRIQPRPVNIHSEG
ncbi:DMT family transporter [Paenibacillus kobensis]|uniref:DMT family transporter n=1 Tax=Paenibacillus kobensis TaxID=59841 RepID=UPI000FDB9DC5|nr:DMT family transporter [Paenibacillus kobensis]